MHVDNPQEEDGSREVINDSGPRYVEFDLEIGSSSSGSGIRSPTTSLEGILEEKEPNEEVGEGDDSKEEEDPRKILKKTLSKMSRKTTL